MPLPRRPSVDLLRLPGRVRGAVGRVREVLTAVDADVVVGFGGYVALPAYLGARGRVPIVVHEANARAGLANKVGARFAARVVAAVPGSGLPGARGRRASRCAARSPTLDRPALRPARPGAVRAARRRAVLLVFGGSQGARTLNTARRRGAADLLAARDRGAARVRRRAVSPRPPAPGYVALPYIERMHLAYAAADAVLGRAGAMTVAEVSAVGLPAVYVPLPHGNGEQALNAGPVVAAGGGVLVADDELTGDRLLAEIVPLLTDPDRLDADGRRGRGRPVTPTPTSGWPTMVLDVIGART